MLLHRRQALLVAVTLAVAVGDASAQDVERVSARLLQEVMPQADRFDPADGDPPAKGAYSGDELIGYVFLTSDLPPEEQGYSGPIRTLVGVTTDGVLTGVRVTSYRESLRYELGDFLGRSSFLEQFTGRDVGDGFGSLQDIDGISGVTISIRALERTVRNTARRVAIAHLDPPEPPPGGLSEADLVELSWFEIQRRGLTDRMPVRQERRNPFQLSLIHLSSEELARHLLGQSYEALAERIEERGGADEVVLYVVDGTGFVPPLRTGWSIEQEGRIVELPRERVINLGRPAGALSGQSSQAGALLLDDDVVDAAAPLTVAFDRGRPDLGTFRVDYTSRAALARIAEAATAAEAELVAETEVPTDAGAVTVSPAAGPADIVPDDSDALETVAADSASPVSADTAVPSVTPSPAPPVLDTVAQPEVPEVAEVAVVAEDAASGSATAEGAWPGIRWTVLVLVLACLAFFTKTAALRWASLATTMVILGWIDGGFLSISHVTGLVWVGLSAIRSDPSLVILSIFTVATVLLWGRVFCGYLCPFGALQDFIDRFVPRRFKRELPSGAHRAAARAKYAILALILGAAIIGVEVSLYQYFEPFGTVFFLTSNALLWAIAGAILVASAVIPRFYCRYVCPLGALLAVGSVLSLRRIPRVEQCDYCRVCEQKCPTRAISGPDIDFAECVRCNICEMQLAQQRGVCRHDMDEIRPRLVQIRREKVAAKVATAGHTSSPRLISNVD